ncbi:MAG TPA: FAD/NAD(P)-binding protein [Lacipirellulaceae bacterium]|nr:FAD/NAD(P)-binding protein [Lacipirellulaceae bacterium]
MSQPSAKLRQLIEQLQALPAPPCLADLAEAYAAVGVSRADVQDFVETNTRSYHRALVARGEHFELLVMTWLPGQASVPHDHAGSICIMQVLEGDAVEGQYRIDPDGFVELDYECVVPCGEVTAGEDAGVHGVRNPADASTPLVTLHCYAPPLRDFRRFVPRPTSVARAASGAVGPPTVVVVGGGFSGSMTAAQLLRAAGRSQTPIRVMLVERRGALGEGVAYGTREAAHLLNVPAARMSAWDDQPDHFLQWAQARYRAVKPGDFLPRMWYGDYVRETLADTVADAAPCGEFQAVFDEVRRVARRPDGGWLVHMARGKSQTAASVVLAVGHRPPSDPIGRRWNGPRTRYIADPWQPFALNVVRPDEPVLILGSGLTAVDAVISLAHPERRAPITILSRRGLLPLAHSVAPQPPADLATIVAQLSASTHGVTSLALLRALRQAYQSQSQPQADWRPVVDGVRPHTAALWQHMSLGERQRFLARLRPFWEVHRHRMATGVAELFGELSDCDWVRRLAGRIVAVHAQVDEAQIVVARRSDGQVVELTASWVVNCTGPGAANTARANPAIGSLLIDGWLQPDELGLGVETLPNGLAIDRDGREVADLIVVGTLRKPALWESTAVPELRVQAATAARQIIDPLTSPALS